MSSPPSASAAPPSFAAFALLRRTAASSPDDYAVPDLAPIPSFGRDARAGEHVVGLGSLGHARIIRRLGALPAVEIVPDFAPIPAGRGLRVFRGAGLEEIGVLHP